MIADCLCLQYITNNGSEFVFRTNKDAPNYRLIKIDLMRPEESNWETLVPQHENDVLDWADCVATDKLILCYIHDVKVRVHEKEEESRRNEYLCSS